MVPEEWFALTPVDLLLDRHQVASEIVRRYRHQHALAILSTYFGKKVVRLHDNALTELLFNSASHSKSTEAWICSQLLAPGTASFPDRFQSLDSPRMTLSVWDDGIPLLQTLTSAFEEYGDVTSPLYGQDGAVFEYHIRDPDGLGGSHVELLGANQGIHHHGPAHLLLSAFFLGISGDPLGEGVPHGGEHAGQGLFIVRRTIINELGGALVYASGRQRLSIERSVDPEADYVARLEVRSASDPVIEGNLFQLVLQNPAGES